MGKVIKINRERLASLFAEMCAIDSPSGEEAEFARFLLGLFAEEFPEAEVLEDDSREQTGSNSNNLIIRFPGETGQSPIFFNCHLDTVEPGRGIRVLREGDSFRSAGKTILGGDDKAGIAILIEVARAVKESGRAHLPWDFVFTTCEEVGLRGAKALNISLLRASEGYALDSTGVDLVISGAPAADRYLFSVTGAAAHAGLNPEKGINAIQLAARCLAELPTGRLDEESTANIGLIRGGQATNIVPESVVVEGEVRSHSTLRLDAISRQIREMVLALVDNWSPSPGAAHEAGLRPRVEFQLTREYPAMDLDRDSSVLRRVDRAAASLGREIKFQRAGGGSDANVFNGEGLQTAIIGIGMDHVHSCEESIDLSDMERTAELVAAIVTTLNH